MVLTQWETLYGLFFFAFFEKIVVPILTSGGLAAVSSSFFAALYSAFGRYDVVHIHAEGPAFFAWLPKMFGKRVVVTVHGLLGVWGKWMKHAKYIYNIQDFNPEQVLAVGYTKSKFITDAMMWFDKFSCKRSDLVITVGRDLVETVENRFKGKKVPKTVMINNWIDENEIYPLDENNEKVQDPIQIGLGVWNFRLNLKNVCTDGIRQIFGNFCGDTAGRKVGDKSFAHGNALPLDDFV